MTPEAPTTGRPSEGGHWYSRDGKAAYDVMGANGNVRPVTLRDARKLDLVPGVSTIIKAAAAPGLTNWMIDQGILAALTLPKRTDETEADWLTRVKADGLAEGVAAAERGTEVHAWIERFYAGQTVDAEAALELCKAVEFALEFDISLEAMWQTERSFAHPLGYGGKADLVEVSGLGIVVDIKTKDFGPEKMGADLAWDEHCMQLAAYRHGLGMPAARCANVFVTRQAPWLVRTYEWTEDRLERGWRMFQALHAYWCAKSRYLDG